MPTQEQIERLKNRLIAMAAQNLLPAQHLHTYLQLAESGQLGGALPPAALNILINEGLVSSTGGFPSVEDRRQQEETTLEAERRRQAQVRQETESQEAEMRRLGPEGLLPPAERIPLQEQRRTEEEASRAGEAALRTQLGERTGLFGEVGETERGEAEQARQRFLQEQLAEEGQERQAREAARQQFLRESQEAFIGEVEGARQALFPGLERSLQRGAAVLGARGITGGFQGSGAVQELARRGAQELEEQATLQALGRLGQARGLFGQLGLQAAEAPLEQRRQARGLFSQLGLEAGRGPQELRRARLQEQLGGLGQIGEVGFGRTQLPSLFGRAAMERGFGLRDMSRQEALERELAQIEAQSRTAAAREERRPTAFDWASLIPKIVGLF